MRIWNNILAAVVAVSLVSVATPAFADYLPKDDAAEQQVPGFDMVVEYLSIEQFVPTRLEFRKLSADPVSDLVKVATGKYDLGLRMRAVQSLGLYSDDDRAVTAVDGLMTSVSPKSRLFRPTLITWASIHGEAVVEAITPYATHTDDNVRLAAVVALGQFCGQAGFDKLKELKTVEENEVVLARISQIVD